MSEKIENYLAEKQERMDIPEEDLNTYIQRYRRTGLTVDRLPKALRDPDSVDTSLYSGQYGYTPPVAPNFSGIPRKTNIKELPIRQEITEQSQSLHAPGSTKRKSEESELSGPSKKKKQKHDDELGGESASHPNSYGNKTPIKATKSLSAGNATGELETSMAVSVTDSISEFEISANRVSTSSPIEDTSIFPVSYLPPNVPYKNGLEDTEPSAISRSALIQSPTMPEHAKVSNHSSVKCHDQVTRKTSKKAVRTIDSSYVTTPEPSSGDETPHELTSASTSVQNVKSKKPLQPIPSKKAKATEKNKSKKKGKELITPPEYVKMIQEAPRKTNANVRQYLKGLSILYLGGDMTYASERTRGRMDIIVKHGGTLVPSYNPSIITHIVTDAPRVTTLRALKLKSLKEIPSHIPTVTWEWILSGQSKGAERRSKEDGSSGMRFTFLCAAFSDRIEAGEDWDRARGKAKNADSSRDIENEDSRISSEFTQEKVLEAPQPVRAPDTTYTRDQAPKAKYKASHESLENSPLQEDPVEDADGDPLAEFYARAKAEKDAAWLQSESEQGFEDSLSTNDYESDTDREDDAPVARMPASKRGFACDTKEPQLQKCMNQDVVDKLEELMNLHKSKPSPDDQWRVYSYSKCVRALKNYPKRIMSFSEARSIRGVGEKTAIKIMEILQTGNLRRIGFERTEDVEATNIFQGIYGVGRQIAFQWFANGCRTLGDVKARKGGITLTRQQEIGVRFYDDINDRMPRGEAEAIFNAIKPIALGLDPDLFIEIMGSFRRGKPDCGDIDILITRPTADGKTHVGVLTALLAELRTAGIIKEDLHLPEDPMDMENIYRGLCILPGKVGGRRRRIDFLTVPWESRGAALLYYTGDDIFNRAMRYKAGVLGYSLNQRGLFRGVVRDPRDRRVKLCPGEKVAGETEQEIFDILGVPWQEPRERVRG